MGMVVSLWKPWGTVWVYSLTIQPEVDASNFFNTRLMVERNRWNAGGDERSRALGVAAEWIDRALGRNFSGKKTVATQPRAWPRDGASCDGVPVPDGTVPDNLAFANFWLAGLLLGDQGLSNSEGTGSNVKTAKAGPAEIHFFGPTIGTELDTRLPVVAMDWLRCFLGSMLVGLSGSVSGLGPSWFDPWDWKRVRGF